jgi:hypothetical protein
MTGEPTKVVMIGDKPVTLATRSSSTVSHLSNQELVALGDHLDYTERQVPSDLFVDVIDEQRQRTAEQEEIALNAMASNQKRRALRQALAQNVPTVIAPLERCGPRPDATIPACTRSRRARRWLPTAARTSDPRTPMEKNTCCAATRGKTTGLPGYD